ncbi:unnamed protein product [Pleuronectes platessa]|uniref:Uncharacterized protein n=1 Tax=Pleuronectes platessa TaxID=8262 RepID=A0A9N7W2A5_PLEPL|nr:unnamed protein product [Pleuronectes platessa]
MDVSQAHSVSALTVVFVNSKCLSSIKIDDTPVDDLSLKGLVANNRDKLKLLKMSSCPHVSLIARPRFMDVSQAHSVSALTVVFVNSKCLSSIKIDDTPVDDLSLKVLVANNRDKLKLLKMSSCPHVSLIGILCVAHQCNALRELALNYHILSDELLLALSSEKHVHLEHLCTDVQGRPWQSASNGTAYAVQLAMAVLRHPNGTGSVCDLDCCSEKH